MDIFKREYLGTFVKCSKCNGEGVYYKTTPKGTVVSVSPCPECYVKRRD